MRSTLVALGFAFASGLFPSASSAGTLHALGNVPDTRLHAIDTVTGVVTPGPDVEWLPGSADLAVLGGRVYHLELAAICGIDFVSIADFDPATGVTGGNLPVRLGPGAARFDKVHGLASDGTRLVLLSDRFSGPASCLRDNLVADVAPDGTMSNLCVLPSELRLDKIVFAPDGRLLALGRPTNSSPQRQLYELDLATATATLRGQHAAPGGDCDYVDLEFTADGELWGLELDPGAAQRLRRIDPATGLVLATVALPPPSTLALRGLARLGGAPTPAAAASWGKVKGTYR
jgi:hypothetical protein